MKNTIHITKMFLLVIIIGIASACGKSKDKNAKLTELKNQRDKIDADIRILESELKAAGDSTKDEVSGTAVAITTMAPQTFSHFIELQGKVDADENVTINAQMPGTVTAVYVTTGQNVTKGQLIAEIDNAVTKKAIDEVEQQMSLAKIVFDKQERLWNQKIGTEIQYLSAKNNKEALDKRHATLEEQLGLSFIKSPINGTVDDVTLKVGQLAAPGMPGIRIVNLAKLKVKADVSESYVSRIKKGNPVITFFPDLDQEMTSTIDFIGKLISPLNRTFGVEVKININNSDLRPNMLAVLKVEDFRTENVLVIPTNIIRKDEGGNNVMIAIMEDGKMVSHRQNITIGEVSGGKAEVISGLKAGDKIITTGFQDLNDHDVIKF